MTLLHDPIRAPFGDLLQVEHEITRRAHPGAEQHFSPGRKVMPIAPPPVTAISSISSGSASEGWHADGAYRKSHPAILMVQPAQDRAADNIAGPLPVGNRLKRAGPASSLVLALSSRPDQLARFRLWFAAFEAGRTDHAEQLDSAAIKLGRLAGRAFADLKRRAKEQ
jgi:hypothetical protein